MISDKWARENLAWAAGLIEGEGCLSTFTQKLRNGKMSNHFYTQLTVGMNIKSRDILERLRDILGIGYIYGPYKGTQKEKILFLKTSKPEHVYAICAAIWPWLGEYRRKQFVKIFQNFKHKGK